MNTIRGYVSELLLRELTQIVCEYTFFRGTVLYESQEPNPVLNLSLSSANTLVAFQGNHCIKTMSFTKRRILSLVKVPMAVNAYVIRDFLIVGRQGGLTVKYKNTTFSFASESGTIPVDYASILDNRLVVLWESGDIELWDLAKQSIITQDKFDVFKRPIKVAVVNNHVVLALNNNSLVVWDFADSSAATGGEVIPLITLDGEISCLHRDGNNMLVGMMSGVIHRVDLAGNIITTFIGHTLKVNTIAILEDGLIASGSSDQTIRIWEPDGTPYIVLHQEGEITSLVALPSNQLASSCFDGTIKIWV